MDKKLKDYLHLYLGCKMKTPHGFIPNGNESTGKSGEAYLTADLLSDITNNIYQVREQDFLPILRPFTDFKKEDIMEIAKISAPEIELKPEDIIQTIIVMKKRGMLAISFADLSVEQNFRITKLLLERGFDLFGLIESGLAIDKTKLSPLIKKTEK